MKKLIIATALSLVAINSYAGGLEKSMRATAWCKESGATYAVDVMEWKNMSNPTTLEEAIKIANGSTNPVYRKILVRAAQIAFEETSPEVAYAAAYGYCIENFK